MEGAAGALLEVGSKTVTGALKTATEAATKGVGQVAIEGAKAGITATENAVTPVIETVATSTARASEGVTTGTEAIGSQLGRTASELALQQAEHTRLLRTGQEVDRIKVAGRIGTVRRELDRLTLQRMGVNQQEEQEQIEEPLTFKQRAVKATVGAVKGAALNFADNVTTDIKTEVANNFEPDVTSTPPPIEATKTTEDIPTIKIDTPLKSKAKSTPTPIPQPTPPTTQVSAASPTNLS